MVYLYAKRAGKTYYYLRVSKREGKRVIAKDVAYLGSDQKTIKEQLNKLDAYRDEIRAAHRTIDRFLASEHYLKKAQETKRKKQFFDDTEVEAVRLHFTEQFKKLDQTTQEEFYEHFLVEFAHNSTAMEGNTITLEEATKLLLENSTPADRTPREIFDLKNTKDVFAWLRQQQTPLTHELIIEIHKRLLKDIDPREGYRTHNVRVFKATFDTSPHQYIHSDMELLFTWLKEQQHNHPLIIAAAFHHKFEKIHPFADGNGRVGRVILNQLLMQHNYPPLTIDKRRRNAYRTALATADSAPLTEVPVDKYKQLIEYVAAEFVGSYWNNFLV